MQRLGYLGSVIGGCTQVTAAQPRELGCRAELLGHEQSVDGGGDKRLEIVVARLGVVEFAPFYKPVEVGAEGQHHGGLSHRRLVEVGRSQPLLVFLLAGNHYAIHLHVARGRGAECRFEQFVEQAVVNLLVEILPYRSSLF